MTLLVLIRHIFSDGCSGQNKNSIIPAMLLHVVTNSNNINEISLRYFETSHGQSEGDSAHSAIGYAIKKAGDVSQPVQLEPFIYGARPKQPYIVLQLFYDSFLDFKTLSKELRVLDSRDEGEGNWHEKMEVGVLSSKPNTIFFKEVLKIF